MMVGSQPPAIDTQPCSLVPWSDATAAAGTRSKHTGCVGNPSMERVFAFAVHLRAQGHAPPVPVPRALCIDEFASGLPGYRAD